MRRLALFGLIVLTTSLFAQEGKSPEPEAFTRAKKMIGGVWRGNLSPTMPVEIRFKLVENGKIVESEGLVGDPKKPVLTMHSRIGVDPITNKVFYLDHHNGTTIYFGHVSAEGNQLVFDFTALSGDIGHFLARQKFPTPDSYESMLYQVGDDGKETPLHPVNMKRMKC